MIRQKWVLENVPRRKEVRLMIVENVRRQVGVRSVQAGNRQDCLLCRHYSVRREAMAEVSKRREVVEEMVMNRSRCEADLA